MDLAFSGMKVDHIKSIIFSFFNNGRTRLRTQGFGKSGGGIRMTDNQHIAGRVSFQLRSECAQIRRIVEINVDAKAVSERLRRIACTLCIGRPDRGDLRLCQKIRERACAIRSGSPSRARWST